MTSQANLGIHKEAAYVLDNNSNTLDYDFNVLDDNFNSGSIGKYVTAQEHIKV